MTPRSFQPRLTDSLPLPLFVLLVLLAGTSVPGHAWGPKKHDDKQQVERLEEQWRLAQLAGDAVAMDRMLAEDFIGISMTGQVNTKTQQLERVRSRKLVLTRLDLGEMKVKLLGQVAIVTVRAAIEGVNEGLIVNGNYRYTRIYQHLPGGGWKITNFESTRIPSRNTPATTTSELRNPS